MCGDMAVMDVADNPGFAKCERCHTVTDQNQKTIFPKPK